MPDALLASPASAGIPRATLYVLNNPWGGSRDLGCNVGTDIHAYDGTGVLRWQLQSVNFEGNAASDPATDGAIFYRGMSIYSGTAGGTFVANTIDPITYPSDPRINLADHERGEHFAQIASVSGHRILVAASQNPDTFYFFHFNQRADTLRFPMANCRGRPSLQRQKSAMVSAWIAMVISGRVSTKPTSFHIIR